MYEDAHLEEAYEDRFGIDHDPLDRDEFGRGMGEIDCDEDDFDAEDDAEAAAERAYFDRLERRDEIMGFHDGPPEPPDPYDEY